MRTPTDYTNNLKQHIITKQMLLDCLYSSNKRAKNWRDKEREYRGYRYDKYHNEEKARSRKEAYYDQKYIMLSVIKPVCIHREELDSTYLERFYDYDEEYFQYDNPETAYRTGSYWDNERKEYVNFVDVWMEGDPRYNYYLFYDIGGNHTFHTPINEEDISKYDLKVIDIDSLQTFGANIDNLVSTQFVKKIVNLIESKDYQYIA